VDAYVAFDLRANNDAGVSRYGLSVLGPCAHELKKENWRLCVIARPAQKRRAEEAVGGLDIPVLCPPVDEGFVRHSPWLREMLISERVDIYFTSHYIVDRECPVPFVFTVHDLIRLRMPQFSYTDTAFARCFGPGELDLIEAELRALPWPDEAKDADGLFNKYFLAINRYLAQRAAGIVTVSRPSADDIRSMLGVPEDKLAIVGCGVDQHVFTRCEEPHVKSVLTRYDVPGPYLMFVGQSSPHKRFLWLVEQLVTRRHHFPHGARLVAVGGHAESTNGVAELLTKHRAEDFVVYTGRVSDRDLAALYSGASALVVASISEGSNLPALEALTCGCPVIATDIPPLHDVLGACVSYYSPAAGEEMTRLAAEALAGRLRNGANAFQPPSWTESGRQLASILSAAVGTLS